MQKLQFREYKNRSVKSQKEKFKNFKSGHYYGFDPKTLSVHMNPDSNQAKESNKLIKIEKGLDEILIGVTGTNLLDFPLCASVL